MARKRKGSYSLLDLAEEVLREQGRALSASDIWKKATKEQKEKLDTQATDPPQTIYCSIQQNIRNHADSLYVGEGRNPVKWNLKANCTNQVIIDVPEETIETDDNSSSEDNQKNDSIKERDLHKILVSYVGCDSYFSSCYCKTIFHERSDRKPKGMNRWIHPDIVGVSYPFGDTGSYDKGTIEFMTRFEHTECKLFSFEVKIKVSSRELREEYFEAVSNSSWAHEGYLVALDYEQGIEDEMKMLNESFGIGFIKLNCENYRESIRLIPAKRKDDLDWSMVNRLYTENPDYRQFIETIRSDMDSSRVRNPGDFDAQFDSDDEFKDYIKTKNIKTEL